ncbi:hypothetical protein MSSAC_0949 [Methanosarcina siciliae C2J]|uniref:Uncharacterized protein n=1 Tax=Methanosarcina siciliae C2J TaxID=1434118 RepID=A0A0E3PK88_9EURY|nr:hypothetical protein [Methanosarcina siciliae]AKB35539.1 hypothetical protein MSSAC_0949 [Methanosarcina siciliae C2J]
MITEIIEFLLFNWQNIFITLVAGAFFYLLSNYAIKNYVNSAEKERIKQAKNVLLDILESRVINKQEISLEQINTLMNAIGREYSIVLFNVTTPKSLLQDLELIFEKSHHLGSSQKEEYCKQIDEQINKIDKVNKDLKLQFELSKDYSDLIDKLSDEISCSDSIKAQNTLNILKEKILSEKSTNMGKQREMKNIQLISLIFTTVVIMSLNLLITNYIGSSSFDIYYFVIFGFLLLILLLIFLIIFLLSFSKSRKNI